LSARGRPGRRVEDDWPGGSVTDRSPGIRIETEASSRADALIHAPLRRFEPGPLRDWGFDPELWESPGRLTLLVLASQLFLDQQERIRFFQAILREGRAERVPVSLRRGDGRPEPVMAEGRLVREGTEWSLRLAFTPGWTEDRVSGSARSGATKTPAVASPSGGTPTGGGAAPSPGPAERPVPVPPELRARAFDRLAVPEAGRTAERVERFLTWVLGRRRPLLVAGGEGAGAAFLVELVHEGREDPGEPVHLDADLEGAPALLRALDDVYGIGGGAGVSGLVIRGAHAIGPDAVERLVEVAGALASGSRSGPPLYLSVRAGDAIVTRFRDDAGGDVFVIPDIRERPQDILPGLSRMLKRPRPGARVFQTVSPGAAKLLQAYDWPGNVDEMREVVEAARLISGGSELRVEDLPLAFVERARRGGPEPAPAQGVPPAMRGRRGRPEKKLSAADIRAALDACDGSRTAAARRLGVSRTTLWRKMAELGEAILDADPRDATRPVEDDGA